MKQRIIGVDIDGVLTDELHPNENIWHNELCNYLGKNIQRKRDAYYFDEAYELPLKTINKFLEERINKIYGNVKPARGAFEIINKLYELGFKIYLITARNPKFKNLTKKWLQSNGFQYSKLIHDENKTPLAIEMGITLFIEDKATTAKKLADNNIKVILMEKYHNKNLQENKNIIRVKNWTEIKDNILAFYNLKNDIL